MSEDFCLSDKIFWIDKGTSKAHSILPRTTGKGERRFENNYLNMKRLYLKDVKKAVKLLKEEVSAAYCSGKLDFNKEGWLSDIINKIFGKDLI